MIAKRFDIWALIVTESAARHRWSLTGAFFKALPGVVSHIGEPSVRVQPRWIHTFQSRACELKMLGGINPEVTTFSGVELLHLFGATSLTEWSRAELSCNGSLGEQQDCYMPTGKPSHIRIEL